jgi:ribosomal protein L37AE/L43A
MGDVEKKPAKLVARARDDCPYCDDAAPLKLNASKAVLVCTSCGYTLAYIDSVTSSTSYSDEYDMSVFSYKRITHFEDMLKLVQAKETFAIPEDVLNRVMAVFAAQRTPKTRITPTRVRDVLRSLRLRKTYEHVTQVWVRITGRSPPRISPHHEEQCRRMFVRMQGAFDRFAPSNRKNFLSYNYVLFRFFHILGLHHMLFTFSLLKSNSKLQAQDECFRPIAEEFSWTFVPVEVVLEQVRRREAAEIEALESGAP